MARRRHLAGYKKGYLGLFRRVLGNPAHPTTDRERKQWSQAGHGTSVTKEGWLVTANHKLGGALLDAEGNVRPLGELRGA